MAKQPTSKDITSVTNTGTKKLFLGSQRVQYSFMLGTKQMLPCKSLMHMHSHCNSNISFHSGLSSPKTPLMPRDVQILEQYRLDVGVSI